MAVGQIKTLLRPPNPTFLEFSERLGPVVTEFDDWSHLLLYPSLVAARGRAHSFRSYQNASGVIFNEAECHYISGHQSDARAARRNGQFCFLVFDAVAYQMLDLFSLAFACPDFFSGIGEPLKEDIARVTAREKPAGYGFFRKNETDQIDISTDLTLPNCSLRRQAALYFSGMALDAVWTHELSHAFMGHVEYAEAHLGIRALNETPRDEGDLRQMPLEAEADRFAAATIVQSAFGPVPYLPPALSALDAPTRVRAGFVVAAVITWFWALQQRIDRTFDGYDPYMHGSHPPPLARLHLSFDGGQDMLRKFGWTTPAIQSATFDAMAELEVLANSKNWFSILNPSNTHSEKANAFVRDVKQIVADTYRSQQADLAGLRYDRAS